MEKSLPTETFTVNRRMWTIAVVEGTLCPDNIKMVVIVRRASVVSKSGTLAFLRLEKWQKVFNGENTWCW